MNLSLKPVLAPLWKQLRAKKETPLAPSWTIPWLFSSLIFLAFLGPTAFDSIQVVRDWFSYWHPNLMYAQKYGFHLGINWFVGGGLPTTVDPSTMVFDPLVRTLFSLLPYPVAVGGYLAALGLLSTLGTSLLAGELGAPLATSLAASLSLATCGLSVALLSQQLIPLYFWLPLMSFLFLKTAREPRSRTLYHDKYSILLVLTLSFASYTATPQLYIFSLAFIILTLLGQFPDKKMEALRHWTKPLLWSLPALFFFWSQLILGRHYGYKPNIDFWFHWPLHPLRFLNMWFTEWGGSPEKEIYWVDHFWGRFNGQTPAYFTNALWISPLLLASLLRRTFGTSCSLLLLGCVLLIATFPSFAPTQWLYHHDGFALAMGRYTEKYAILFIFGLVFHFLLRPRSSTKEEPDQKPFSKLLYGSLLLSPVLSLGALPALHQAIPRFIPIHFIGPLFAWIIGLRDLISPWKGPIWRRLVLISVGLYTVTSWFAFKTNFLPYDEAVLLMFRRPTYEFAPRISGRQMYISREASRGECLLSNRPVEICSKLFSSFPLYFDAFSRIGYSSFLKRQARTKTIEDIANTKPQIVVLERAEFGPHLTSLCPHLQNQISTLVTCEEWKPSQYEGPLRILELTHKNDFHVVHTDPYLLRIETYTHQGQTRLPYWVPPGGQVLVDGTPVSPTDETDYGTTIPVGIPGKHTIEFIYNGLLIKKGLLFGFLGIVLAAIGTLASTMRRRSAN